MRRGPDTPLGYSPPKVARQHLAGRIGTGCRTRRFLEACTGRKGLENERWGCHDVVERPKGNAVTP